MKAIADPPPLLQIFPIEGGATSRPGSPLSAIERLAQKWQIRRQEALDAVSKAIREGALSGAAATELAKLVHNVAGTAGMFGENELGSRASALERALNHGDAAQRNELAQSFLRAA